MKKKLLASIIVIFMMGMMSACIQVHNDPPAGEEQSSQPATTEEQATEAPAAENASSEPAPQQETKKSEQSSQNDIGAEKAKEIALADAGVNAKEAVFKHTEMDYDDGFQMYEVEFYANDKEFSYEIDATNGNILSREIDIMDSEDYMEMEALK